MPPFDRSKLPPEFQTLLTELEMRGVKIEISSPEQLLKDLTSKLSSPESKSDECPCPVCARRRVEAAQASNRGKEAAGAGNLPPRVAERLGKAADELVDRVVKIVGDMLTPLGTLLKDAQNDIERLGRRADAIGNVMVADQKNIERLRVAGEETWKRIDALEAEVREMREIVRKQVGLLHKRVTKRKGEIAVKANKRKSRGSKNWPESAE